MPANSRWHLIRRVKVNLSSGYGLVEASVTWRWTFRAPQEAQNVLIFRSTFIFSKSVLYCVSYGPNPEVFRDRMCFNTLWFPCKLDYRYSSLNILMTKLQRMKLAWLIAN